MLEVIKPGLETSVQDYPGRYGRLNLGFPWSGAMDSWSLRLGNILVGNDVGAAGLECQFIGPSLKISVDTVIAVTGADMQAKLDGDVIPMWESVAVAAGQELQMSFAKTGARGYVAIAGGIDCPQFLRWTIEVVRGPNDDWVDEAGHERFLNTDWKLSAKSDRSGFRLDGPDWTFADKAHNKRPEHGSDPANIIDQGYPVGAINLAGQTPIILVSDGPSMGGFINPYTVPQCAFWKLGQSKPSEHYRFEAISVDEAQQKARDITALCTEASII
jgi:urea carboxylase